MGASEARRQVGELEKDFLVIVGLDDGVLTIGNDDIQLAPGKQNGGYKLRVRSLSNETTLRVEYLSNGGYNYRESGSLLSSVATAGAREEIRKRKIRAIRPIRRAARKYRIKVEEDEGHVTLYIPQGVDLVLAYEDDED